MKCYVDDAGFYLGEVDELRVPPGFPFELVDVALPTATIEQYKSWGFDGEAWVQLVDNRGRVWYNPANPDDEFIGRLPGDTPPLGYVDVPNGTGKVYSPAHLLSQAKARCWESIKKVRDDRTATGGYKVVVGAADKWFHSDVFSRTQQLGLVLLGENIPVGLSWKCMDGSFVGMTPTLAQQVFTAAAASDTAIFAAAEYHRTAMEACTDPQQYDYTVGWPLIYGETPP